MEKPQMRFQILPITWSRMKKRFNQFVVYTTQSKKNLLYTQVKRIIDQPRITGLKFPYFDEEDPI